MHANLFDMHAFVFCLSKNSDGSLLIKISFVFDEDLIYDLIFPVFLCDFLDRNGYVSRVTSQSLDYILRNFLCAESLLLLGPSGIALDVYVRHISTS